MERPTEDAPIEIYTPERCAEFILNSAVDAADFERARDVVLRMGLDPDAVPHVVPNLKSGYGR